MTPEDQKALEAIEAAKAAGTDPFGDDEPLGTEPEAEAPEAAAAEEPTEEVVDEVAEPEAEAAADPEPVAAPEAPQSYTTNAPADYKAQRAALLAERSAALKKMLDGEIEAEAYTETEMRVSDALEELTAQRIRAETLQEANAQSQQAYQQRVVQRLVVKTKAEVDYAADESARTQFDTALQVVAAQPANRGKDFADLIEDAHAVVKAMRGVMPGKPASAPSPATRANTAGQPPVTLRSLPSASQPNTGSVVDQISRLKGPAYEAAFNKLTSAQKASLLETD